MKKSQLEHELTVRGIDCIGKRNDLDKRLQEELLGTQRSLTLLYRHPTDKKEVHNLGSYEVFSSEGLHDIKAHVKNVMEELPFHLAANAKSVYARFYEAEIGQKALARGSDYRRAAFKLPTILKGRVQGDIQGLVNTLAELAALLYILEANRTPRAILRLYNIAFKHAHYCVEVLFPPKHLSVGVLFGLYYHKLTVHAAEDTRIVSGYTRLAEIDERQFKELRGLATMTTRRSEDVARQLFEQIQMKGLMSSTPSAFNKENAQLSARAAKLTCMAEDTTFTEKFIKSQQASFQAHLQRIADYLLPGPGIWWKREGSCVRFCDGTGSPDQHLQGPSLVSFRSTTVQDELHRTKACWEKCLDGNVELPLQQLRLQRDGERARYVSWPTTTTTVQHNSNERTTDLSASKATANSLSNDGTDEKTNGQDNPEQKNAEENENKRWNEDNGEDNSNSEEVVVEMQEDEGEEKEEEGEEEQQQEEEAKEEKHGERISTTLKKKNQDDQADSHCQEVASSSSTKAQRMESSNHTERERQKSVRRRLPFTTTAERASDDQIDNDDVVVHPVEDVCPDHPVYRTFHAKWTAIALGDRPDIQKYDELRAAVKKGEKSKSSELQIISDKLQRELVCTMRDIQTAVMKGDSTKQTRERRRVVEKLLSKWSH